MIIFYVLHTYRRRFQSLTKPNETSLPRQAALLVFEPTGIPVVFKTNGRLSLESQETEIDLCEKTYIIFMIQNILGIYIVQFY